jgi:hypothetical protein
MGIKNILLGAFLYFLGQLITYWQLNGQFLWEWFKKNPFLIACMGIPISYIFIEATKYAVSGFDGQMWPNRFIGFATGMIVYAWGTSYYFNQPIDTKTAVSLALCLILIIIQIVWK